MSIADDIKLSRRRFLQASGAAGALGIGLNKFPGFVTLTEAKAAPPPAGAGATVITKSICHQCPARCGIDVYTTDGRVHAIYGSSEHPISNGKLCPKGPLGAYILYDPDRFKGPMKRTNPKKGREEDPKFVPISWEDRKSVGEGKRGDWSSDVCSSDLARRLHPLRPRSLQGADETHQPEEGPRRGPEVRADLLGRSEERRGGKEG